MHYQICNGFYSYKLREMMCVTFNNHAITKKLTLYCLLLGFTTSQPTQFLSVQYRPLFILNTRVSNKFHSRVYLVFVSLSRCVCSHHISLRRVLKVRHIDVMGAKVS